MADFREVGDMVRSLFMVCVYLGVGLFLCFASYLNVEVKFPGGTWNYIVGILAILYSFLRIYQLYIKLKISKNRHYE